MTIEMPKERVREMGPEDRNAYDEQVHVVRFNELRPEWSAYREAQLPAFQRALFGYIGTAASENPAFVDSMKDGENFAVTVIMADHGRGAAMHCHTTEEMFMPLTGRWGVYWGEPTDDGTGAHGKHQVFLDPWDAIVIPAPVMRGFWNASTEQSYLLAILGGGAPPTPTYAGSVLEQLR